MHQDAEMQVLLAQVQQEVDLSEPVLSSSDDNADLVHSFMHTELLEFDYKPTSVDSCELLTSYAAEDQGICANYHLVAARDTPFDIPDYSDVYFEGCRWKLLTGQDSRRDTRQDSREFFTVLRIQRKANIRRSVAVRTDDNLSLEECVRMTICP